MPCIDMIVNKCLLDVLCRRFCARTVPAMRSSLRRLSFGNKRYVIVGRPCKGEEEGKWNFLVAVQCPCLLCSYRELGLT